MNLIIEGTAVNVSRISLELTVPEQLETVTNAILVDNAYARFESLLPRGDRQVLTIRDCRYE